MKIAYFDCFSGASGDMILGSLLGAGLKLSALQKELKKLPLSGYTLSARSVTRAGFAATKLDVRIPDRASRHVHERGLKDILSILTRSRLADGVRSRAARIFRRLAEAEAEAHGKSRSEIHFHEVGAVDSIVDIVGAVAALELLGVERVECSPLALGRGTIVCSHGALPVPAPGTAALLKGVPIQRTEVEAELTTPTGAAILTALAADFGPMPAMTIDSVGTGAGAADRPELPNILRVFVGETAAVTATDEIAVVETNIDDTTGELCGAAVEKLFEAGAVDVYFAPIQMKKNRPAALLTALVPPEKLPQVERALFEHTTTFGLRVWLAQRRKLERKWKTVRTPYGAVRVKLGSLDGRIITVSPEFEDCRALAERKGVPVRAVYAAAQKKA